MKPVLEKVIYQAGKSVRVEKIAGAYCTAQWHFHPEYELVLITKGCGKRYIGDHIEAYDENDLVFIGHNLPHVWISDPTYYTNQKKNNSEYFVLQFTNEHLPQQILTLPEFESVRNLLDQSRYGIRITGSIHNQIRTLLQETHDKSGLERYISFLRLLDIISREGNKKKLASQGYIQNYAIPSNDRLQKVYQYVMENYPGKVTIQKAAYIANMNVSAFCRFFKEKTKRTFTQFVNEIRIGATTKILSDKNLSVSQAAFENGFNNLSYFNRQFKKIVGATPNEFIAKQKGKNWNG